MFSRYPRLNRRNLVASSLLGLFLLNGCATQITFRHREALDAFVGLDRSTVIEKLGAPTSIVAQNNVELLAYEEHHDRWIQGRPGTSAPGNRAYSPWIKDSNCTTTFRVSNGKVDGWNLNGNDCRDLSFPATGTNMEAVLAEASQQGVDRLSFYPRDNYTDRSPVNDGEFYSH